MKRREQNQARKDWDAFKVAIKELDLIVTTVLLRGTFDSGIRHSLPDVLSGDSIRPPWNDETGETAIRFPEGDSVDEDIEAMATNIHNALNIAKKIMAITPANVAERALESIPNCAACGDQILGRIFYSRWDEKCRSRFRRWVESGHSADEKLVFEKMVSSERAAEAATQTGKTQ
jgi:hypothetical protein